MDNSIKIRFTCKFCGDKTFAAQSTLNRHFRDVHKMKTFAVYDSSVWNYKCLEKNCNTSFKYTKALISHLESTHNLEFKTEVVILDDLNKFYQWKTEIEINYKCQYITKSQSRSSNGIILYFFCNRTKSSYVPKKDSERIRSQKKQGSCKLNSSCTSNIKVVKNYDGVRVEWQKIHYGHDFEIEHLRLPKPERHKIFSKIISGYTPEMILENLRETADKDGLNKAHLLTPKDIRNIKNSYQKIELDQIGPEDLKKILADKNIIIKDKELKALYPKNIKQTSTSSFNSTGQISETRKQKYKETEYEASDNPEENKESNGTSEIIEVFPDCYTQDENSEIDNDVVPEYKMNEENAADVFENENNEDEDILTSEDEFAEKITVVLESPENEEQETLKEKECFSRKRGNMPEDITDYVETDLDDPEKRHQYWIMSQAALKKYMNDNYELQTSNAQMLNTIAGLNGLITELKNETKRKKKRIEEC